MAQAVTKKGGGLIIAVDGPAGAGKSVASRRLAARLGYRYVDTGALYRVVGLLAWEAGVDPANDERLGRLCEGVDIEFEPTGDGVLVRVNGRDVTREIRRPEIAQMASKVSARRVVRERLLGLQRRLGEGGAVVMEGRDIGTVVFPGAEVKFFLRASADERGRRRYEELRAQGAPVTLEETVRDVEERDRRDRSRRHAPLRQAGDACVIDTDNLTVDGVVQRMWKTVERKLGGEAASKEDRLPLQPARGKGMKT